MKQYKSYLAQSASKLGDVQGFLNFNSTKAKKG